MLNDIEDEGKPSAEEELAQKGLGAIVEKFLDSIVADDTSNGKGTDNMTCILVRLKQ